MQPTLTEPRAEPATGAPTQGRGLPAWMPLSVLFLLFVGLARQGARPLSDPDTWWHLRLGEEFAGAWSLNDPGQLTTFATRDWFATQWIPEVVAHRFEQAFGLPGVAWLYGAALLVLLALLYGISRSFASILPAAVAAGVSMLGASASLSARPQLVSFILLALFTWAWLRTADDLRPRWWLVPATWVWACSHGMWFTGVVVGVAVIVGLAADRRLSLRVGMRLALVPALCVVAAGITPVGPKLLLAPLATSGMAPYVTEWAAPSFKELAPAVTLGVVAIIVATWSRAGIVPWHRIAVLVVAVGWTVLSARTVALGAVMLTPLLAATLQSFVGERAVPRFRRSERLTVAAGLFAGLALLAAMVPSTAESPEAVPIGLDDELAALPAGTIVLNEYTVGGWLEWQHRDLVPVIDGMTDAYEPGQFDEYMRLSSVGQGWQQILGDLEAEHALLVAGSPLATALETHLDWIPEGTSEGYVLLQAPVR